MGEEALTEVCPLSPSSSSSSLRKPAQRLSRQEPLNAGRLEENPLRDDGKDRPNRRTSKIYPKLIGYPYRSAIVVNARTGKILYENRSTTYCYPASITKLMTAYAVFRAIKSGQLSLEDEVLVSEKAWRTPGQQ